MKTLVYIAYKITEKIFARLKIELAFKTKYGLKNINMSKRIHPVVPQTGGITYLSPDELFLGYDYLKDEFTLLDVSINDSPHYDLMKLFYEDPDAKELSKNNYIQRWLTGTLDWRLGYRKPKDYNFFIKKFKQAKDNLENNCIEPVIVYKSAEKYYIYDGKHRAAMCAYNNAKVPCIVVKTETMFMGVWKTMFKKIKADKNYKKHSALYIQHHKLEDR